MHNPFELLGVSPQASDEEVRQSYLRLVREFPPDRSPERFAEIRAAYDEVRDPLVRVEKQLFSFYCHDSLESLAEDLRERLRGSRYTLEDLRILAESR